MVPGVSWDRTDISNIFQQITVGYALTRAREGGGADFALPSCFSEISKKYPLYFYELSGTCPKMNGTASKEKKRKIYWTFWDPPIFGVRGDVDSKNDPPGHTGALLVTMPRRQYELFIVVVKLNVVERLARRHLKALIKTYLIHA